MGADLRRHSASARRIFVLADDITGLPITRLCDEGPIERLTETDAAQPAVVATSLAATAVLQELCADVWAPAAAAGHSVGELAAYTAAGALDAESALRLVRARSTAMLEACREVDGTMLAVLAMDEQPLRELCLQVSGAQGLVEIANFNAPGQLVISGERTAVLRAAQAAKEAGARRVAPLNVDGPFHSTYMRPAADAFSLVLGSIEIRPAAIPVVANVSGKPIQAPDELRAELACQVYSPVRWTDALTTLSELGCDRFIEIGHGQTLAALAKRTVPGARTATFGSMDDLESARALLESEGS